MTHYEIFQTKLSLGSLKHTLIDIVEVDENGAFIDTVREGFEDYESACLWAKSRGYEIKEENND